MASKTTKMAQEADASNAEELSKRGYMADAAAWDNDEGQEFGGKADVVKILVGEIAGPFTYLNHVSMETDLGKVTVHQATTEDKQQVRLPISATFVRAVDQADLKFGDVFLIKRSEDVEKKRGKGAGNDIPVFAIKVLKRGAGSEK